MYLTLGLLLSGEDYECWNLKGGFIDWTVFGVLLIIIRGILGFLEGLDEVHE